VSRIPDFDDLVGREVSPAERARLHRAHELLVEAGPPPELSPEMDAVPWPDDALGPVFGRRGKRRTRPMLLAAAIATALVVGLIVGQATTSSDATSIDARETVELSGTKLADDAFATLQLGEAAKSGNWPMLLHVRGLPKLENGGYYDLYLTKGGVPLVSCGTFNARGETDIRLSAAYNLERFDKDGWVVVRKTPGNNFDTSQVVLRVTNA
jgi:hypothetical protein